MSKTYFPKVQKPILYEGKDSKNPFAFKYDNKKQRVGSKTMGSTFASPSLIGTPF